MAKEVPVPLPHAPGQPSTSASPLQAGSAGDMLQWIRGHLSSRSTITYRRTSKDTSNCWIILKQASFHPILQFPLFTYQKNFK